MSKSKSKSKSRSMSRSMNMNPSTGIRANSGGKETTWQDAS